MTDTSTRPADRPQAPRSHPVRRLLTAVPGRSQLLVAALVGVLGFATVVQVRTEEEGVLERAGRSDLVQILDGLTQRADRLAEQVRELDATRRELLSGVDSRQAALEQARQRARELAVLAGTAPATGPGVEVTVTDPTGDVQAAVLLSAVQELRDAGAEAIAIEGSNGTAVRVVASTYFLDGTDGVLVHGVRVAPPYTVTAIGDPPTLATALSIPGGVVEEVSGAGGRATVRESDGLRIDVLHAPSEPQYARPAPDEGD